MKNIKNLTKQYAIRSMTEEDSAKFSSDVMQSIKQDSSPVKIHVKKTVFARFSMIGSSIAAAIVATLLIVSQVNNTISPEDLEVGELITVLNGIGEESMLYSATESESLYDDILLAEELEEKL